MPTGYTSAVADGKITTLRDFALQCARGMTALITMRDDPWDAPIPERFEANLAFYGPELERARALLAELPTLSPQECERRASAERDEELRQRNEYAESERVQLQRYRAMLKQVEAWDCGAEGLKEFMLQQLNQSIQFDCPSTRRPEPEVELLSGSEWRERALANASRDVARYSEQVALEHERTVERNRWIKALRDSLDAEESAALAARVA